MDLSALCVYSGYYFMYISIPITFLFRRFVVAKYLDLRGFAGFTSKTLLLHMQVYIVHFWIIVRDVIKTIKNSI